MRTSAVLILFMFWWNQPVVAGQQLANKQLHSLIERGIDLTLQQDYEQADSLFRHVTREFPEHPAGYLYQAAVMQSRAMDYESRVDVASFDSLIKRGKQKAERLIDEEPSSPWGYYFLGTAYGYDSYARVFRGDWFGGALQGLASVSQFKKSIARDSTMYDACAGIGTFYYWRSRRTAYFNWLPFLGDDRSDACTLIQKTIRQGTYNRYTAISMLVTIYIDAEKYDAAAYYANLGLGRYPNNRMFLWGEATALQKRERFGKATQAYRRLLQSILDEKENNHYNEIVCRLNLVKVQVASGDSTGVDSQLQSILAYENREFPEHLRDRAKDKFQMARDLQRGLTKDERRLP